MADNAAPFDQDALYDDPQWLAQKAGISPAQATSLPLAVLRSIALGSSYSEGQNIPAPYVDRGEPSRDPSGRASVGQFQDTMNYLEMLRQDPTVALPLSKGGRVRKTRRARRKGGALQTVVEGEAALQRLDRPKRTSGALSARGPRRKPTR